MAMYTEATDLFTFDSGTRQQSSERVTPHKMSLLILIFEFKQMCAMEHSDDPSLIDYNRILSERDKRNFMLLLLELLQSPDMDLKTLRCRIEPVMKETLYKALYDLLREISHAGVRPIHDFFETNSTLLTTSDFECVVRRESIVGLFIRRMELAYNEMSFSQVVETYKKVRRYYEAGFPEYHEEHTEESLAAKVERRSNPLGLSQSSLTMSVLDERSTIESLAGRSFFSKKQAEYFIANQSLLLSHNESQALPPDQLQQKITSILSANPDLAEAHFLSYMNCLRIKEYCTAIQNLYNYFLHTPRKPAVTSTDANKKRMATDDVASRYATLNLASLQYRFGNRKECKAALKEAIHMAQDSKDEVCLQHTLMWLNLLEEDTVSVGRLECSIKKMFDLALPTLSVLGYNSLSRRLVNCAEKPSRVMNLFTESNLTNCHHSNYSMMASGFAHRSMLWNLFGNRELSLLDTQIVLNLNTSINSVYYCGQAVCIAMCSMAQQHADGGQYQVAMEILSQAKANFPSHMEESRIWQSCLQQISFNRAILHGRLNDAEQILVDLRAVDEMEARLRKVTLLRAQGEVKEAFAHMETILKEQEIQQQQQQKSKSQSQSQSTPRWAVDANCRVLLELADLLMATGNHSSALLHITQCISQAGKYHLELYKAMATIYFGFIQLYLQLPEQGIGQIESQLVKIYSNASAFDKARVLLAYAKCKVAASKRMKDEANKSTELDSALELVTKATQLFHSVEAHHREKDSLHYQSLLYHQMGRVESRNKCAHQFNKLDQLYPTLTSSAISVL